MLALCVRRLVIAVWVLAFAIGSASFSQAQSSAPSVIVDIDNPGPQSGVFQGLASFSGWALGGTSAITVIQAQIDGAPMGAVKYGFGRPDVCAVFPNRPACPNVGWSFNFDTTAFANGTHTLTIEALSPSGSFASQSTSFTVANWTAGSPFVLSIDSPNAQASYSGTVVFGGWSLVNASAIRSVAVQIDGISYGNALGGVARPDVCAVFPNSGGCPNVGWDFAIDTTSLTDGQHTLAITLTSNGGQNFTVTRVFSVQNFTSSNPIRANIDSPPIQGPPLSGNALFGGWALNDNGAIVRVATSVDGVAAADAQYGSTRADVCQAFPGRSGCPKVGWNLVLDTKRYASGPHIFQATVYGSNGQHATVGRSFTIDNSGTANPIRISIDRPNPQTSLLVGTALLSGWAIDDLAAVKSVQILIDGTSFGNAAYKVPRPDVCSAFPGRAGCPNVGWSLAVDTTRLANGSHTLYAAVTGAEGRTSVLSSTFTVANWSGANPMRMTIDYPSAQSAALTGVVNIGGWAINDLAAIAGVMVSVDGTAYGNAVYGAARPDVCTAFANRPGCPNVGWSYALDTTTLANGLHALSVSGTSTGGQQMTVTTQFQVNNPISIAIDTPSPNAAPFSGSVGFGGWSLNTTAKINSVAVAIDGVAYGNAVYGGARPDVCNVFRAATGCPNVGWNLGVDTSVLTPGSHTLSVAATSANGLRASVTRTFLVNQPNNYLLTTQAAGRILEQATWGPTTAAIQDLQTKGFDAWFNAQAAAPISTYDDQAALNAQSNTNTNLTPVQTQFFQNALSGSDQLRQRMALALSEIWVVSANSVTAAQAYPPLQRIFESRALDNYENLMRDVTLSPAMGAYLNMVNNDKASASRGTSPNENFGREIMQLFTLGVTQLNLDGTPVLDENGNGATTYSELDVENLARALTGWTYGRTSGTTTGHNPSNYLLPMVAVQSLHDTAAKLILGASLSSGRSAEDDLNSALHIIFLHPNLPPFVSRQLIQHLVTSNPSPSYVQRVAQAFEDNGNGVRGDLRAVVYAILTDPEARAGDSGQPSDQPSFGHMREPILFVASLLRGLNATLTSASNPAATATNLGQRLFYSPSVFSYFSPKYRDSSGLNAPEFQIYSTQTAVNQTGAVNSAVFTGKLDAATSFDLSAYTAAAAYPPAVINLINTVFFHGQMSLDLQDAISSAMSAVTAASDKAKAALYVALTSGEFSVIH